MRRFLSGGVKIRGCPVIGFDRLLSGVFRLFTLLSIEIRIPDLPGLGRIYKVGNDQIRSIRSVRIRRDPGLSDVRESLESVVFNDT